jgi:ketose-bisphosphate aldolase
MKQKNISSRKKKIVLIIAILVVVVISSVFSAIIWSSSMIQRVQFSAPEALYDNWDDILSHPKPITINTYSTGMMQTPVSAIINLEHEHTKDIEDELIEFPVTANIIQHQQFGVYLIDAGLDASYVHSQYGTQKGLMVKSKSGKGSQEPGTHIAAILKKENIQIQGVFLTHLHPDHVAGIVDLPKDVSYIVGKGELYVNFKFFMHTDHLAGVDKLEEFDFDMGIDLTPFGKSIDIFGDGSLWAISSSGHSKGHVIYFINGIEEKVLVTGDACNTQYQFDIGIGPGTYSSNVEQAQDVLDRIVNVPACIHLDHGKSLKTMIRAIRAGFTSIMYDGSEHPLDENIKNTAEVVKIAHSVGVSVEGEIGNVGGEAVGIEAATPQSAKEEFFTKVEDAVKFSNETGIDALAISIGNIHGLYKGEPRLDFDRLKSIRDAVNVPLVLHGGSGISDNDFRKAASFGICKINFYTGITQAAVARVHQFTKEHPESISYPDLTKLAMAEVKKVVKDRMKVFGSKGQCAADKTLCITCSDTSCGLDDPRIKPGARTVLYQDLVEKISKEVFENIKGK